MRVLFNLKKLRYYASPVVGASQYTTFQFYALFDIFDQGEEWRAVSRSLVRGFDSPLV